MLERRARKFNTRKVECAGEEKAEAAEDRSPEGPAPALMTMPDDGKCT